MQLYDCHTHTNYSLDAKYPMQEMLQSAYDHGLNGIAVTDHADVDFYVKHNVAERMWNDAQELKVRQKEWAGRLEVIRGVEIGQPLYSPEWAQGIIDRGEYDFVIGAVHSVRGVGGFYSMNMGSDGPAVIDGFLKAYFREVNESVRTTDFDTFPHLTYPLRYIRQSVDFPVDYRPYEAEIREIMTILAGRGKAYELNLKPYAPDDSAWRNEECWLLTLFKEQGGEYVTLGTDSHVPEKIGYGLADGQKMLKECGFDAFHIYRERKRVAIPIEE